MVTAMVSRAACTVLWGITECHLGLGAVQDVHVTSASMAQAQALTLKQWPWPVQA